MIFITGGVFQGKRELAERLWKEQRICAVSTEQKSCSPSAKRGTCAVSTEQKPCSPSGEGRTEENGLVSLEQAPIICSGEHLTGADGLKADIITDFHLYIRELLRQGKDAAAKTEELLGQNPNLILTMAELGCGIVPMEAFERAWRETAGRIGCSLAARAEAVYRVVCGMEQQLK